MCSGSNRPIRPAIRCSTPKKSARPDSHHVHTSTACVPSETTLCLSNNRFRVEVRWTDFEGHQGSGRVVNSTTTDSGIFWFFAAPTWELMVKVLNACQAPYNRFWVFAAGTTTVQYTLRVTETSGRAEGRPTSSPSRSAKAIASTLRATSVRAALQRLATLSPPPSDESTTVRAVRHNRPEAHTLDR